MTEFLSSHAVEAPAVRRTTVRRFRQILLWPLQLMPLRDDVQIHRHWEFLAKPAPDNPWREVEDEFTRDPGSFQQRHYAEFVNFLPYVQRVLYGEGRRGHASVSPIRVFRRDDVRKVRITLDRDSTPLEFEIAHVDLYFFFDMDVVIPVVEIFGRDLDLDTTQNILFRFGRAYPAYWEADGRGGHCSWRVEWVAAGGEVLSRSDFERREKYLAFVCEHRSPAIAAHWEWLLRPMVQYHSDEAGPVRYRQLEYHRMPTMAYLALDDVEGLSRGRLRACGGASVLYAREVKAARRLPRLGFGRAVARSRQMGGIARCVAPTGEKNRRARRRRLAEARAAAGSALTDKSGRYTALSAA